MTSRRRKPSLALYVYLLGRTRAIGDALRESPLPEPLETNRPLASITVDDLAAVVSAVPLNEYGEGRFEERLKDPMWAAEKAMRHQAVTAFFNARAAVIPLRFGAIYSTARVVGGMLQERASELTAVLARLEGCQEWGLEIRFDRNTLDASLARLSPDAADLTEQARESSPGRAYLLSKQADRLRASQTKKVLNQIAEKIAASLAPHAREMKPLPLKDPDPGQRPELAASFAFLIAKENLGAFTAEAESQARRHAASGFHLELTGPWQAYNFVA